METRPGHILIVDDDPLNRRLLEKSLEASGHHTIAADNGFALKVPACATREARSHVGSPRNPSIDMYVAAPQTAPPGNPPATIFASVVRSGVTP